MEPTSPATLAYPTQDPRANARTWGNPLLQEQEPASPFGEDGLSFKDIMDAINPLQQLPIVSSLYRDTTGDSISTASRLIGGALLGGPVGFIAAAINAGLESSTGQDAAGHLLSLLNDRQPNDASSQTAQETHAGTVDLY